MNSRVVELKIQLKLLLAFMLSLAAGLLVFHIFFNTPRLQHLDINDEVSREIQYQRVTLEQPLTFRLAPQHNYLNRIGISILKQPGEAFQTQDYADFLVENNYFDNGESRRIYSRERLYPFVLQVELLIDGEIIESLTVLNQEFIEGIVFFQLPRLETTAQEEITTRLKLVDYQTQTFPDSEYDYQVENTQLLKVAQDRNSDPIVAYEYQLLRSDIFNNSGDFVDIQLAKFVAGVPGDVLSLGVVYVLLFFMIAVLVGRKFLLSSLVLASLIWLFYQINLLDYSTFVLFSIITFISTLSGYYTLTHD